MGHSDGRIGEGSCQMSDVDFERLQAFANNTTPPRREAAPMKTVPAINNGTLIWGGGLVGFAIIMMLVVMVIGGASFAGDVLMLGTMGVLACGVIFCLSALGAYVLREMQAKKVSTSRTSWVAAQIVDRQFDASIETGGDFVFLELLDGRRVRLLPQSSEAKAAKVGDVGWASYKGDKLLDFAAE